MSSFSFSLTDRHVTMAASDDRPVTDAPPCAVCIIKDGTRSLLCSDPTTDGSGPGALRDVDLRHFLTVMYRDGRSRPPRWFTNPFTYKGRERRYVATTCNPTLFSLDDEYQQRFERLLSLSGRFGSSRAFFDWTQFYVYGYQSRKGFGGGNAILHTSSLRSLIGTPDAPNLSSQCLGLICESLEVWFTPGFVIVSPPKSPTSSGVAVSTYDEVSVEIRETNLIAPLTLPGDEVLGTTWTYVNKDGSPDRRYNQNSQLAVVRMWEVDLLSQDFRVDMQFADGTLASNLAEAVNSMKLGDGSGH